MSKQHLHGNIPKKSTFKISNEIILLGLIACTLIATDATCSVVCVSVCVCFGYTGALCKNG